MARHPEPTAAMRTLGLRVRELRDSMGLRQGDLGRREGLDRTLVSKVETGGRQISLLNVLRLARALETDPAVLLDGLTPEGDRGGKSRPRRRTR